MKTRISILWVVLSVNYLGYSVMYVTSESHVKAILESPNTVRVTVENAVALNFIALIMAWLAVSLKGAANRWTNLAMGVVMALTWGRELISSGKTAAAETLNASVVVCFFGIFTSLLIVFYSWKLPKRDACAEV